MNDMRPPRCFTRECRHFKGVTEILNEKTGVGKGEKFQVPWCFAFPSGIPDRIAYGGDLHTTPAPDQYGIIVYEKGSQEE